MEQAAEETSQEMQNDVVTPGGVIAEKIGLSGKNKATLEEWIQNKLGGV